MIKIQTFLELHKYLVLFKLHSDSMHLILNVEDKYLNSLRKELNNKTERVIDSYVYRIDSNIFIKINMQFSTDTSEIFIYRLEPFHN